MLAAYVLSVIHQQGSEIASFSHSLPGIRLWDNFLYATHIQDVENTFKNIIYMCPGPIIKFLSFSDKKLS